MIWSTVHHKDFWKVYGDRLDRTLLWSSVSNPLPIIVKREVKDNSHVSGKGNWGRRGVMYSWQCWEPSGRKSQGPVQTMKHQIINCKRKKKKVLQTHIAGPKFCSYYFEQCCVNRSINSSRTLLLWWIHVPTKLHYLNLTTVGIQKFWWGEWIIMEDLKCITPFNYSKCFHISFEILFCYLMYTT